MKKVRIVFAAAALLLGTTTAFATASKGVAKHYRLTPNGYDLVVGYSEDNCVTANNTFCTYVTSNSGAPSHINIGQEGSWGLSGDIPNAVYVP